MTIRASAVNYTIKNPFFGYTSNVSLGTVIKEMSDGTYTIWDNGAAYDVYRCTVSWLLSLSETNTLIGIFQDIAKGRGDDVELTPDAGFFPFGPNKGDDGASGPFTVRIMRVDTKQSIGHPEDFFNTEVEFKLTDTFPSYTPPAQETTAGSLQIGTISNLRYPGGMHNQDNDYDVRTVSTFGLDAHSIDKTLTADSYKSDLALTLQEGNAAALLDHIEGTVRANNVNVIPPTNSYLFGRENGSTATYVCKLIQNEINIVNERHNLFNFNLKFYRISG